MVVCLFLDLSIPHDAFVLCCVWFALQDLHAELAAEEALEAEDAFDDLFQGFMDADEAEDAGDCFMDEAGGGEGGGEGGEEEAKVHDPELEFPDLDEAAAEAYAEDETDPLEAVAAAEGNVADQQLVQAADGSMIPLSQANSVTHPSQFREFSRTMCKKGKQWSGELMTMYEKGKTDLFRIFLEKGGNMQDVEVTVKRSQASQHNKEQKRLECCQEGQADGEVQGPIQG